MNNNIMGNLLYIVALILVIFWAIGYFGFKSEGGIIHLLLVVALIALILNIIRGRRI